MKTSQQKETQNFNSPEDVFNFYAMSPECSVDIHLHDSYEIFIPYSDNIRYFIEGHSYDLSIHDLIITNNQEIHRPTVINQEPYSRYILQFKPFFLQGLISDGYNPLWIFNNRPKGQENLITLKEPAISQLNSLIKKLEEVSVNANHKANLQKKAILIEILILLESNYKKNSKHKNLNPDPKIKALILDLDQNYTKKISLDQLAGAYFLDKYHLCHLFKKNTGFSILEYIQSKRIQLAKSLIVSDISFQEISRKCGFDDYSNFYKTFKKYTSLSPKAYKNTLIKTF
jgi:AraC-like DNA-binding protein